MFRLVFVMLVLLYRTIFNAGTYYTLAQVTGRVPSVYLPGYHAYQYKKYRYIFSTHNIRHDKILQNNSLGWNNNSTCYWPRTEKGQESTVQFVPPRLIRLCNVGVVS